MLGDGGTDWMTRLQMLVAKKLLATDWSQSETAKILGTTQSTISRLVSRQLPSLPGSADEAVIDGWANELAQALIQL
ncbi:MAG: helix-turn-helix domain-containing protein, partial [Euryarchaeota archaeon]|nr:helix-turn-helix domain-containing protein [Euryarchaeota archaeon]